jgi:hypothetical protein
MDNEFINNSVLINKIVVAVMAGALFPLGIYLIRKIKYKTNELMLHKNIQKSKNVDVDHNNDSHEMADGDIDDIIIVEYVRDRNLIGDLHVNKILSDVEYKDKLESLEKVRDQKIDTLRKDVKRKSIQRNREKFKDMIDVKLATQKLKLDQALSSCIINEKEYNQKIEELKSRIVKDVDDICSLGFNDIVGSQELSLMELKKINALTSGSVKQVDGILLKNRSTQKINLYSREECAKFIAENQGNCYCVIID